MIRPIHEVIEGALAKARVIAEDYDQLQEVVVCAGPPICVLRGHAARAMFDRDCRWCLKFTVNTAGRVAVRQRYGLA